MGQVTGVLGIPKPRRDLWVSDVTLMVCMGQGEGRRRMDGQRQTDRQSLKLSEARTRPLLPMSISQLGLRVGQNPGPFAQVRLTSLWSPPQPDWEFSLIQTGACCLNLTFKNIWLLQSDCDLHQRRGKAENETWWGKKGECGCWANTDGQCEVSLQDHSVCLCREIKASHGCQAPGQRQTGLDPTSTVSQARTALCLLHFCSPHFAFFKLTRHKRLWYYVLWWTSYMHFNSHSILMLETSSLYSLCTRVREMSS